MKKIREDEVLERLRLTCLDFPETKEVVAWGHPNFKAGKKTFAVLETYKGELSLAVKTLPAKKESFLKDTRFYDTPYIGNKGWVSLRVYKKPLNWTFIDRLVETSYRLVALSRMLKQLDSKGPK